ncbi:hypothetical protein, partial [Bradyrhizobium sp. ORS 375]|uniref:hypothetical protein n=1 Tax=Bradyrhizobium sp. (strain ORS 375) TaxID=566679 RepID=UPI0005581110
MALFPPHDAGGRHRFQDCDFVMFDWPLDWIALLVAFAALAFARRTSDRLAEVQARLAKLEAARAVVAGPAVPDAPPLSPL